MLTYRTPQESVPGALTKDKKRIRGQEISVHVAWKSTLYVTNFPEKADDAYIRKLFGQVRKIPFGSIRGVSCAVFLLSLALYSTYVGPARNSRQLEDSAISSSFLRKLHKPLYLCMVKSWSLA